MLDPVQLRMQVVRPVLLRIGLHSADAEELVMATGMQESRFIWIRQLGNGPAKGLWQMEPRTHDDIWENWLAYKSELASNIRALASQHANEHNLSDELIGNLPYAAAMCRCHYRRVREALPNGNDVLAMAKYWKKYYNTYLGAGTVEEFVANYSLLREEQGS